jgi:putative two-component system response regulator
MAHYTRLIARELGLGDEEQDVLLQAAPLHDLGKIGIPDAILLKPGPLSAEERTVMQTHATIGWQILGSHTSPILRAGAEIAHSHHEKFDGSGYPRKLAGERIPLHGRIVAVADVFDALTSVRPYKAAWPVEEAKSYLRSQAGAHFDPKCVAGLLNRWDEVEEIMRIHPD